MTNEIPGGFGDESSVWRGPSGAQKLENLRPGSHLERIWGAKSDPKSDYNQSMIQSSILYDLI